MLVAIRVIWFVLIMTCVPYLTGEVLRHLLNQNMVSGYGERVFNQYFLGFWGMLAIFELLCVPMCYARTSLTLLVVTYSAVMLCICIAGVVLRLKSEERGFSVRPVKMIVSSLNKNERIYSSVWGLTGAVQMYFAIFYCQRTGNLTDDMSHMARTLTSLHMDRIVVQADYVVSFVADWKRSLASWEIWNAWLCRLTGFSPTVVGNTLLAVTLLPVVYASVYLLSSVLMQEREDRLLFMAIFSIVVTFSFYSYHSYACKMLMHLWYGRALLKVVYIPYMFYFLIAIMRRRYSGSTAVMLAIITLGASGVSMTGFVFSLMMCIGICILLGLGDSTVPKANMKYVLSGSAIPLVFMILYVAKH